MGVKLPRQRWTFLLQYGVVLGVAASLGACSSQQFAPTATSQAFLNAIASAHASGADDSEISLLERASASGVVTITDVREALEGTYGCLDAAGISHTESVTTAPWGTEQIQYDMRVPADTDVDAAMKVADKCTLTYSAAVESLYVSQPAEQESQDAWRKEVVVPALKECLNAAGVAYDDEASFDELNDLAFSTATSAGGNADLKTCVMDISPVGF